VFSEEGSKKMTMSLVLWRYSSRRVCCPLGCLCRSHCSFQSLRRCDVHHHGRHHCCRGLLVRCFHRRAKQTLALPSSRFGGCRFGLPCGCSTFEFLHVSHPFFVSSQVWTTLTTTQSRSMTQCMDSHWWRRSFVGVGIQNTGQTEMIASKNNC